MTAGKARAGSQGRGGRIFLIPPPTYAARRKGTQRLRCSMGRCSRCGSLKAAFRWWYQANSVAGATEEGSNWTLPGAWINVPLLIPSGSKDRRINGADKARYQAWFLWRAIRILAKWFGLQDRPLSRLEDCLSVAPKADWEQSDELQLRLSNSYEKALQQSSSSRSPNSGSRQRTDSSSDFAAGGASPCGGN